MDSLVFDTSALLNFGHRGDLAFLLERLASNHKFLTTPSVVAELTDPARADYYEQFLSAWFKVQSATTALFDLATLAHLSTTLDAGEITVMMLAKELKATAVLDEKPARREADLLAVRFTGTLGLLHDAMTRKWITNAEALARVIQLCDAGFRIPKPAQHQNFAEYLRAVALNE